MTIRIQQKEMNTILQALDEERKLNRKLLKIGEVLGKVFQLAFKECPSNSKAIPIEDILNPTHLPPYFSSDKRNPSWEYRAKWVLSYCKKKPTYYIGVDGSKLVLSKGGIIRIKGIVHSPGSIKPINFIGGFIEKLNIPSALDVELFEAEAQGLRCMIHRMNGDPLDCNSQSFGCPKNKESCDLKKLKKLKGTKIAFFDRPISSMYFRDFKEISKNKLVVAQKALLDSCKKFNMPLIGVVISSKSYDIIDSMMTNLSHNYSYVNPADDMSKTIFNWIENNKASAEEIINSKNLPNPKKLINEIISKHADKSNDFRTIDYQLVGNLVNNIEERTIAFKINNKVYPYNDTLGKWYPDVDINFFYIGYLLDWARIEFAFTDPSTAYLHYLLQSTILPTYYPAVLAIAHKLCTLNADVAKVVRKLSMLFGNRESLKVLTKKLF